MKVMMSCGEASGDLYAGALVTELRRRAQAVDVFGFERGCSATSAA
jgi:lipid A disaccharide synthetase